MVEIRSASRGQGQKGLSPDRVVAAATELTRQRGLSGWSVRDLAARLGVASSAVYHHVGDRAEVLRRVVAGLIGRVEPADPDLAWQEWFERTTLAIWGVLRDHPGVALWFMMHGPTVPGAATIVDAGIATLKRAGFGDRAGYAYSLLLNQSVGAVALSDERTRLDPADGDRRLQTMMVGFEERARSSPGMAVLTESMLRPLLDESAAMENYLVESLRTTMRGLEAELAEG